MTLNESAFENFPTLKTRRLTLREIRMSDAQELFEMQSNPLIFKYIPKKLQTEINQAEKLVEDIQTAYDRREMLCWAATIRDGKKVIGTCGFNRFEKINLRAEIGGSLSPDYWGSRVSWEAVEKILDYGLNVMNLHTIEAKVDPSNRSAKYLLERLGFEQEAYFKDRTYYEGKFTDLAVYTLHNPAQKASTTIED